MNRETLQEISRRLTRMKLTLGSCSDEIDWYVSKDRELVPRMNQAIKDLDGLSKLADQLARQA